MSDTEPRRRTDKRSFLVFIVTILIIGAGYAGFKLGQISGLQEAYLAHVLHTRNNLVALQCLQAERLPAARSMLETSVATGVVMLDKGQLLLWPRTEQQVTDILGEVRGYRTAYPWTGHGAGLTERVERILANVSPRPLLGACKY